MLVKIESRRATEDGTESMPLLPAGHRTSAPDIYEDALEWPSLLLPADVSSTTSFESKANVDINDGIRSRVPRRSSNPRTSSDIEAPKKTLPLLGELYTSDELHLARLSQLCLPDWTFRQQFLQSSQGIRPERPEFSIIMQKPSSEAWNRALRRVQQGFFVGGPFETILDGEKKTRKMLFKVDLSEDSLLDPASLFVPHKPVLCAVSIIVYDIEARERPGSVHDGDEERHGLREGAEAMFDALAKRINPIMEFKKHFRGLADVIFRHMLLTDYGMEKPPIHFQFGYREDAKNEWPHLWCVWNELCAVVSGFAECCTEGKPQHTLLRSIAECIGFLPSLTKSCYERCHNDVVLMLHYYHTRRMPLETAEYMAGSTGYQGVLQEMIDEVPVVGTERLARKLSVDVNEAIPMFLRLDIPKGRAMIKKAEAIASAFGIDLYHPRVYGMGRPLLDLYYRDGFVRNYHGKYGA